jgi:hypothetical protein
MCVVGQKEQHNNGTTKKNNNVFMGKRGGDERERG